MCPTQYNLFSRLKTFIFSFLIKKTSANETWQVVRYSSNKLKPTSSSLMGRLEPYFVNKRVNINKATHFVDKQTNKHSRNKQAEFAY